MSERIMNVLLVDDDWGDVELMREALDLANIKLNLNVVSDGVQALAYLRKLPPYENVARPDLILMDLNMPKKDGREVLKDVKTDPQLKTIPVVMLTTSDAEIDVLKAYELGANSYITKPVGLEAFSEIVKSIVNFWFTIAKLPTT